MIYTWCECPELNARTTWWLAPPTLHVFQDALPTAARFCRAVRQQVASLAAARGDKLAQCGLADMLSEGRGGPKDEVEARPEAKD